jgi:multidrug efflux system outer membrane protein
MLILPLLFVCAALAAEPLSWNEVRASALGQNAGLNSARKTSEASVSAEKEAVFGGYLPKLTLNANRTRNTNELPPILTKQTDYQYGATASLNMFRGLATVASVSRAKAAVGAAESAQRLTSANLRHDLRVAYFNIYVQQERLKLNEKDLKRSTLNYRLEQLKYDSGSEALWGVRTAKADLDRAQFTLNAGKTQLATARESLSQLLQVDAIPDRPVADPDKSALIAPTDNPTSAILHHPELDKFRFLDQESLQDIRLARAAYFPTLDLSFNRSYLDAKSDGVPAQNSNSSAFAITAGWSIFNGAADYYAVQQASLNHEAAELNTASTERRLVNSLRTKNATYRTAIELLPVDRAAREAAEEREKVVSGQYRSGLKAYIDWEQAESTLLNTEQDEIRALADALTAYADLELSLGLTLEQR